jgi:hypothetical protein
MLDEVLGAEPSGEESRPGASASAPLGRAEALKTSSGKSADERVFVVLESGVPYEW